MSGNIEGGQLLVEFRLKAGLTQVELAKKAQKSRSMIAQLEIGERNPSRKLLHSLATAMSLSEDEYQQLLLAFEFKPSGPTPEQITAFLRADKNLDPEQADRIAALVKEAYEKAVSE